MSDTKKASQQAKPYSNPQETLKNVSQGQAIARDIAAERESLEKRLASEGKQSAEKRPGIANPEFKQVFDLTTHRETHEKQEKIKELQSLLVEIRREVQSIKAQSEGLTAEAEQVERAALQSLPDRVGIYHVRYFEIILEYLKNIKTKVGEAKTWLMAMNSKKTKRGSAFAKQSKKQGTQFSLSQELAAARNVT